MVYQMTGTLSDQEYKTLATEVAKRTEPPEMFLRDLIRHLSPTSTEKRFMTGRELAEKLYREVVGDKTSLEGEVAWSST